MKTIDNIFDKMMWFVVVVSKLLFPLIMLFLIIFCLTVAFIMFHQLLYLINTTLLN